MQLLDLFVSVIVQDQDAQDSLQQIQEQAQQTGEKFKTVGANMAKVGAGVVAGVGAIGGALFAVAADADNANRKIQATLGMTAEQAKAVSEATRDYFKKGYVGSMEEASEAILAVKQQMSNLSDTDLSKITQQATAIANTFNEDIGQVSRGADTLMKVFGISAEEAMDKVTVGFQKGLNYSGEFVDSLAEYSVYFNNMGMSSDDMLNMMVAGMENGAFQLDKVGDAIKENFLRLSDMGKGEAEAIKALGLNSQQIMDMINSGGEGAAKAYEMVNMAIAGLGSETERTAITTALYGTQSEDVGKKVMEAMRAAGDVIGDTTGKAAELNNTVSSSPAQQFTAQWNTLKDSLVPIGTELMKMAMEVLPYVSSAIQGVSNFMNNMSPEARKLIVVIGAVVGAFGGLLLVVAPIVSAIGTMLPLIVKVGGAIAGVATPIGWVIAGITALTTAGVLLYKNWDSIASYGKKAWGLITTNVSTGIENTKNAVGIGMDWISDKYTKVTDTIASFTDKAYKNISDNIIDPINNAKNRTEEILTGIQTKFTDSVNAVKSKTKTAFEETKNFIVKPIELARDKVGQAIDKIKSFFTNLRLKMPSIELPKMPKFDLKTSTKSVFGKEFTYPSGLDIKWNAKGGVFNKPTLFNTANAGLQGVGEAGAEAILPLNDGFYSSLANNLVNRMKDQKSQQVNNITNHIHINGKGSADEIARLQLRSLEALGMKY